MVETNLICDESPCRKSAALFRHVDKPEYRWKLIGEWKTLASKDGMIHACSHEHAEKIDWRIKIAKPLTRKATK
jgi:hypothetical protein